MSWTRFTRWIGQAAALPVVCLLLLAGASAESCATGDDVDAASRAALQRTAQQFFGYLAHGDAASLRQNSIASLASDFAPIEQAVNDRRPELAGASSRITGLYLLDATDRQGTIERAEFLCGVWGPDGLTPSSVAFVIPGLPAGKYAAIFEEADSDAKALHVSFVVQQDPPGNGGWRLAGLQIRELRLGEHDGHWFLEQARAFQAKGQFRNAFFYYGQAHELLAPVPFMTTLELQRIEDAQRSVLPADLPSREDPIDLTANGQGFRVTSVAPVAVGNGLDLVIVHQPLGGANAAQARANDVTVIRAFIQKYPEYRDAFAGVVARTGPSDPGALLPMTEIK